MSLPVNCNATGDPGATPIITRRERPKTPPPSLLGRKEADYHDQIEDKQSGPGGEQ